MTRTIAVPHRWQPTMFLGDEIVEWTCAANPTERLAHSWHGEGEPPEGTCFTVVTREETPIGSCTFTVTVEK